MIKYSRILVQRILISSSLLLLLGFLIYWNFDLYEREKAELIQDLENQMSLASSEYRDSVAKDMFKLIRVQHSIGESKSDFPVSLLGVEESTDSVQYEIALRSLYAEKTLVKEGNNVTQWSHRTNEDTLKRIDLSIHTNSQHFQPDDLIVFATEADSSIQVDFVTDLQFDTTIFLPNGDSLQISELDGPYSPSKQTFLTVYTRIASIFDQRLEASGINIPHEKRNIKDKESKDPKAIYISFKNELLGFLPPVAVFNNFQPYLFQKIAPSFLLSLLLFAIVAISYYVITRSWAEQLRLTKLKNEFISNMTHELNTPIATIGVAMEALENYGAMEDPVKRHEYINISKHETARLKLLVDKVLTMSATDHGYSQLSKSKIQLDELLENTLSALKYQLENKNAAVQINKSGDNFAVHADPVQLTNVLQNLIDNAIKYCTQNPEVKLDLQENTNSIIFRISDNGIGIPREYQNKVFDRFFRVPQNDLHNAKGHGLGLHYAKSMVALHQGKITLDKNYQNGTSFIIELPKLQ